MDDEILPAKEAEGRLQQVLFRYVMNIQRAFPPFTAP